MRDTVVSISQNGVTNWSIPSSLKSTRLSLRPFQIKDSPQVFRLHSESDVNEFLERPRMNSILQAESYINEVHSIVQDGEAFAWAITSLSTSDFMGEIYLWNIYHIDRRAEVSLELLPEYQNNGLGFEALNTLIEFAFRNLHLHSIEADVDPANDKAISLLEKCGFKREGYFREINFHQGSFHDRAIYSLIDPYTSTIKEL